VIFNDENLSFLDKKSLMSDHEMTFTYLLT